MASETFDFVYRVSFSNGTYKLVDANPFRPGVNPVDNNGVKVSDHGGHNDSPFELGDVNHDRFTISQFHGHNGAYTFVTLATDSQGHSGFIAEHNGQYYLITDDRYTGPRFGSDLNLTAHSGSEPICFMPGTMIEVPAGEVAVEVLKRGDMVATADGRSVPINWVGRQTVSRLFFDPTRVLPIRIKSSALGDNIPSRDVLLSPDHAVLIEGVLVQAGALVNGVSIVRETDVPRTFTYYHIELFDHSLILAENLRAETFLNNVDRLAFDNWDEFQGLYPDGKTIVEMPYPRAKASRQIPKDIKDKLSQRVDAALFDGLRSAA